MINKGKLSVFRKLALLLFLIFLCGTSGWTIKRLFISPVFKVMYAEDGFIKERTETLAFDLNKIFLKHLTVKPVDFYAANFFTPYLPSVRNKEHYNILWLGGQAGINYDIFNEYDLILTSSVDLLTLLKGYGFNAYFYPPIAIDDKIGDKPRCVSDINDEKCYFVMFGENEWLENILNERHIRYKRFNKADYTTTLKIRQEKDFIAGIIANDIFAHSGTLDFSLLYLDAVVHRFPVLTHSEIFKYPPNNNIPLVHLLGDTLYYYNNQADLDTFFKVSGVNQDKSLKAASFVQQLLSPQSMAKRLAQLILTGNDVSSKIPQSFSITSPTLPGQYNNGDYWIAKDLERAFSANGHFSLTNFPMILLQKFSHFNIYIRGGISLSEDKKNDDPFRVLYILFPMMNNEELFPESQNFDEGTYFNEINKELLRADIVATASSSYTKFLNNKGIEAYFVPQFTDPEKFYPDYTDALKTDVLFVGNKTFYRITPQILLKHNIPLDIYGNDWGGLAKAEYIDNQILRKYYSSAKIVLNDTRPAMRKFGFISNRIYDVSACGSLVVSDYMPEIEEIYGDSVPMWKTEEELVALIEYYLDPAHEEERLEKAKRAQEITLQNFTAKQAAEKFNDIINEVKREK